MKRNSVGIGTQRFLSLLTLRHAKEDVEKEKITEVYCTHAKDFLVRLIVDC